MALQTMLLQADDGRILVFPAWPTDWDVEAKLHAPLNTTIEVSYAAGVLQRLTVRPPYRRADCLVLLGGIDADSDADGLPDAWELAQWLDLTHTPEADDDGDGVSNADEYAAGTDPNDPAEAPDDSSSSSGLSCTPAAGASAVFILMLMVAPVALRGRRRSLHV
jgi:hypothetical protein